MHRVKASLSDFPVLYGFTPGPLSNNVSEIRLIRRRTDAPMPYLWCVIQFGHHRLQTFVPFCIQDQNWLTSGKPSTFTMHHYPSRFGTDWEFGEEEYRRMDWSRENVTHTTATASFQVNEWIRITSPAESGGNTR